MGNLNQALEALDDLLLSPKEQKPKLRLRVGAVLRETQNLHNELVNSSVPWSFQDYVLPVSGGTNDYPLTGVTGKILFVTAQAAQGYPYPVDFTDLADASRNWWYYYPLTAARPEDYNFSFAPAKISFYRKDGVIWAKIPSSVVAADTLTITYSTGNWTDNIPLSARPVLEEYQHLALIRAAKSLALDAEWYEDIAANERKAAMLRQDLREQEQTVLPQFALAKRSMNADDVVYIRTNDDFF